MKRVLPVMMLLLCSCYPAGTAAAAANDNPAKASAASGEPEVRLVVCGDASPTETGFETLPFVVCICTHPVDGVKDPARWPAHILGAWAKPEKGVEL